MPTEDPFDAHCDYCDRGIRFPDTDAILLEISRNVDHEATNIEMAEMTLCSEAHLAAYFDERGLPPEDDWALDLTWVGFQYGGTIVVVVTVALAVFGIVRLVMDLF